MKKAIFILLSALLIFSCSKREEYSLDEWETVSVAGLEELLAKTQSKPWRGEEYIPGRPGGTWNSGLAEEPKTFNILVAERDGTSSSIVEMMLDWLVDYDVVRREWKPKAASAEVVVDEEAGTLKVICTLRDDLYWSFYNSDRKIPVTSDDVIFWYDEIVGDWEFYSSGYNGQWIYLEDGSDAHIDIERIDDKRFSFNYPRIVAEPLLSINMTFGPAFIYERAKQEGGVDGVLDLFSIDTDPREIPSMGRWFLTEYVPGLRMVFTRNPDYWEKDSTGYSYPYVEQDIVQILPDTNTQYLVFKEGGIETYGARPEDLDELIEGQSQGNYTVYNNEGSLGASFWSFNQNPQNSELPEYEWFTQKEFRQAMSCILNRNRVISQVYRGLAEPTLFFFAPPNPYYNPAIQLQYLYDPQRAISLLASIGITRDTEGVMRDSKGRAIEFDLSIPSDSSVQTDIASIVVDEASKIGIKITVRQTDFQFLVEQLTVTYDWSSIFIALGVNYWPTQGSNVWPSDGNLHLWYPMQEEPATEWEARVDYLYNEGSYTADPVKAQVIWDEYQRIILEQCPLIYLMRQKNFAAINNRWDFRNFYYDNLNGAQTDYLFLKAQ